MVPGTLILSAQGKRAREREPSGSIDDAPSIVPVSQRMSGGRDNPPKQLCTRPHVPDSEGRKSGSDQREQLLVSLGYGALNLIVQF